MNDDRASPAGFPAASEPESVSPEPFFVLIINQMMLSRFLWKSQPVLFSSEKL
jgi:hypothetical protein